MLKIIIGFLIAFLFVGYEAKDPFKLFYGDYWIIDLEKDYNYALAGSPNREYLWILSRTKIIFLNSNLIRIDLSGLFKSKGIIRWKTK